MKVRVDRCKRWLAGIWSVGAAVLFIVLVVQSMSGYYGGKTKDAWGWFLTNIVPISSLMAGVLVSDALKKSQKVQEIDSFVYWLALAAVILYMLVTNATIFVKPYVSVSQTELMTLSSLWLAPLQGAVAAFLGAFFVKKGA